MPQSTEEHREPITPGTGTPPPGSPPDAVPERDVLNHANFGLLPGGERRIGSIGVSLAVNITIAILIVFFTVNQVHEMHVHQRETLVYVPPPPPPIKPYIPPAPKVPPPILPKEQVKIPVPKPVIEPPKVQMQVAAKAPAMPAPAPRPVVTPPKPVVGVFRSPQAPAQQAQRVAETKAAGFGNPSGVHANPNANRPSQLAVTGGFGATQSSDQGAASRLGKVSSTGFGSGAPSGSPNGSSRGVVASTGFGSGSQPAGMPGGHGTVASTGFGSSTAPGGSPHGRGEVASTGFGSGPPAAATGRPRTAEAATTPIVVLAKPLPAYTEEARAARIEGDVTLEVRFTAEGQVQVLRVVSGLGHGLDEQARIAAQKIRFRPATRDGRPVDQVSVIHVTFQLA